MRIKSCHVVNFASYKELDYYFDSQGLVLIQGPTGSGKSTLCDVIPWVLFGTTAKGGSVTDVLSWPGDDITVGTVHLDNVTVTRTRGPKPKDNDLFYFEYNDLEHGQEIRGKDLNDTQKLINSLLGIDASLYLAGAYFHEFSETAQFFTTTAKNRRAICEQLVDLSLATKLQPKLRDELNVLGKKLVESNNSINTYTSNIDMLKRLEVTENNKAKNWEVEHDKTKKYVMDCYNLFEVNRKKVIHKKCNSCGTVLESPREVVDTSANPYMERLAELEVETNPHDSGVKDYTLEIASKINARNEEQTNYNSIAEAMSDIETLQELVTQYRSISIENTILTLETNTNRYLERFFDSECKVTFTVESNDKLDVVIHKDGNECSYSQLSKGQRQLLKLCLGTSVMSCVQNHHGVKFNQVFFDEALDGLDESMKSKAYSLLETLSQDYDSVFVVEHSEGLKSMFSNKLTVELVNGKSQIASPE